MRGTCFDILKYRRERPNVLSAVFLILRNDQSRQGSFLLLGRRDQLAAVDKLLETIQNKPAVAKEYMLKSVHLSIIKMRGGAFEYSLYVWSLECFEFRFVFFFYFVAEFKELLLCGLVSDPNDL